MNNLIKDMYTYELELSDGTILEPKKLPDDNSKVVRLSYIPKFDLIPRHDIIFSGFKLVKRFSRTFQKMREGVREKLHIIVTDKFRIYIFSSTGRILVTAKDYELYI